VNNKTNRIAELNELYEEVLIERNEAQAVVTAKFVGIATKIHRDNPTDGELDRLDLANQRLETIKQELEILLP
jgi:hypothetical protein